MELTSAVARDNIPFSLVLHLLFLHVEGFLKKARKLIKTRGKLANELWQSPEDPQRFFFPIREFLSMKPLTCYQGVCGLSF